MDLNFFTMFAKLKLSNQEFRIIIFIYLIHFDKSFI